MTSDPKLSTPPRTDDVSAFVDMLAVQLFPALVEAVRPLLANQTCPCSCHTTPTIDAEVA
jgi:hypothetical protein